MAGIYIPEAAISAEAERRGLDPVDLSPTEQRRIRTDLARQQAEQVFATAAAAQAVPDHLTVTVEVTHGDRVLNVTQQHIPINTTPEDTAK